MVYFLTGTLPWATILQSDEIDDMSKSSQIFTLKRSFGDSSFWQDALIKPSITSSNLELKQLPSILRDTYKQIVSLDAHDTPNYSEIRKGFKRILVENYLQYDFIYDWILLPMKEQLNEEEKLNADSELMDICSEVVFSIEEEERLAQLVKEYDENID